MLLKRSGELGVRILEGTRRSIQVLPHARQSLDQLGSADVELGIGSFEFLAGRIRHVPARDQVVDQVL